MFGATLQATSNVGEHMSPGRSTAAFWSDLDVARPIEGTQTAVVSLVERVDG
jgi:hypothetical protein